MNTISANFPKAFPAMQIIEISHQYKKEFGKEVKLYTGPLIFETESTLEGISKVITQLIDVVCPVVLDSAGRKTPAFPTTFSGDNKTEKSARSAQLAFCDNGDMRDCLRYIEGRHELLHFQFMLSDVVVDCFGDTANLEEAVSLSRLISILNPKLSTRKGKDDYYKFRDTFQDIYVALLAEFVRNYLGREDLNQNVTPEYIENEPDPKKKEALFVGMFREIIRSSHADFEDCVENVKDIQPLPLFYPHEKYMRMKYQDHPTGESLLTSKDTLVTHPTKVQYVSDLLVDKIKDIARLSTTKKTDAKNDYVSSMLSFLGQYLFLVDCQKNGNGLDSFLIQKKLTKIVFSTGHKNYSSTLINFKQIILGHWSPQFSHRYLWNTSAGRAGKSLKMPRDQRQEHLNRYLKDSFKSVGVNMDEANASRINNSCDLSMKIERKIVEFHELDDSGKGHTKRDRSKQIETLFKLFQKEKVAEVISGRKFKGPVVARNLHDQFDEASYRAWHCRKEKEMKKFTQYCKTYR